MSDGTKSGYTKSNYTKTGKKVKSIYEGRVDLTYNGVYDVFIDSDEHEFIINDVGHKHYAFVDDKNYYELVDDVAEATDDSHNTNETKPKFKVGDKVKVVDDGYISAYTHEVKVGDVGVITYADSDYVTSPYCVEFDDDYWWFTDKCIELVVGDSSNTPIKSDGGSSSYYAQQIPKGMLERFNATGTIEAKDVIRLFLGNDFNMGNIFKAYCRVISLRNGKGKAGIDEQYDLTKAKFFTEDELNYYLENKDV